MEINKLDTEMLYATGLTAGLGSNDIGLDRGQSGRDASSSSSGSGRA
jgi:hypothetical protein